VTAEAPRRTGFFAPHTNRLEALSHIMQSIRHAIHSSVLRTEGPYMPGDPIACREHAQRCAELAAFAATPEERDHLLSLQSNWIRFAAELESAGAFLKTMDEIDLKQPYTPEAA
jgi:hypothetical protein